MADALRVAIIGTKFMGRAHSNALIDVPYFFDLPLRPALQVACGRNESSLRQFARRFGWQHVETDWEKAVRREDVDLVDIVTSNATHRDMAVAAAQAGKHILCEKPLAVNAAEAYQMLQAAREAGITHMVAFNYRRLPALALARQLIAEGKLGTIRHFNAVYYQDWLVDPRTPHSWRNDAVEAGSGAHGDMNAHTVDLARFLVGEIAQVCAAQTIFVRERPLAEGSGVRPVTADDATYFLAAFENGALGNFMGTRFAAGRKNYLRLEIFGSEGALAFNLERLNELEYYSAQDDGPLQGFRTILVTEGAHPYVDAWWPPGHILGWEHTFIHEMRDLIVAIARREPVQPDFYDGWRCQLVLDAAQLSAQERRWASVPADE